MNTMMYLAPDIPLSLLKSWSNSGIVNHIFIDTFQKQLTLFESFELQIYLELHLLGLKPEALQRISSYFHRYGMEGSIENLRKKSFEPISIDQIIKMVQEGKNCFLVIDLTGVMRVFEDEILFMTFMKDKSLVDQPASIIISANRILERIGFEPKRERNTYIKKSLQKEMEKRFG